MVVESRGVMLLFVVVAVRFCLKTWAVGGRRFSFGVVVGGGGAQSRERRRQTGPIAELQTASGCPRLRRETQFRPFFPFQDEPRGQAERAARPYYIDYERTTLLHPVATGARAR